MGFTDAVRREIKSFVFHNRVVKIIKRTEIAVYNNLLTYSEHWRILRYSNKKFSKEFQDSLMTNKCITHTCNGKITGYVYLLHFKTVWKCKIFLQEKLQAN